MNKPFFAKFDPKATWLTDLVPAFGEREFFFAPALRDILESRRAPAWGDRRDRRGRVALFGHVEWE